MFNNSRYPSSMTLILIRHGQSEWQIGVSRSLDSSPTELGRLQGECVAEWAKREMSDGSIVRVSPLVRALATAEAMSLRVDVDVVVEQDLAEAPFRVGSLLPASSGPFRHADLTSVPDRLKEFVDRVEGLLCRTFAKEPGGGEIVWVTHSGVIETVLRKILGCANSRFSIDNGSITVIEWTAGHWFVRQLNAVDHISPKIRSS